MWNRAASRVGRGWQTLFLPLVLTGLNRLAKTPVAKTGKNLNANFASHMASNSLEQTKTCQEILGGTLHFALISFIIGDCSKCYVSYCDN